MADQLQTNMKYAHPIPRHILPVSLFTLAYVGAFTLWFFSQGNREFILYVLTMAGLIAVVGFSLMTATYPVAMRGQAI